MGLVCKGADSMPREVNADFLREMKSQEVEFKQSSDKWGNVIAMFDSNGEIDLLTKYMREKMLSQTCEYLEDTNDRKKLRSFHFQMMADLTFG